MTRNLNAEFEEESHVVEVVLVKPEIAARITKWPALQKTLYLRWVRSVRDHTVKTIDLVEEITKLKIKLSCKSNDISDDDVDAPKMVEKVKPRNKPSEIGHISIRDDIVDALKMKVKVKPRNRPSERGHISRGDSKVIKIYGIEEIKTPYCPNARGGKCDCIKLSIDYNAQGGLQSMVYNIIKSAPKGGHKAGNAFLSACIRPSIERPHTHQYVVPVVREDNTSELFSICCGTFRVLFNLKTSDRMTRLRGWSKAGLGQSYQYLFDGSKYPLVPTDCTEPKKWFLHFRDAANP